LLSIKDELLQRVVDDFDTIWSGGKMLSSVCSIKTEIPKRL